MELGMNRSCCKARIPRLLMYSSVSLISLGILLPTHIVIALALAPPEKQLVLAGAGSILLNCFVGAVLIWMSRRVLRGERLTAAVLVVGALSMMALLPIGMALTGSYNAKPTVTVVQAVLLLNLVVALSLLFVALCRAGAQVPHQSTSNTAE